MTLGPEQFSKKVFLPEQWVRVNIDTTLKEVIRIQGADEMTLYYTITGEEKRSFT